ncbi:MAG: tRNA uridine-5-carboxymethylaminomethyl(34) synthesis GTPase MnmE [Bacillota bacterium]|nr:tRNA uridine-5-carboxymethylaminomethyl(34) synthesis GTPase MnmE [Bacillota bacterium]
MEDTIAAVATAYGEGGIGIVKISGPETERILKQVFEPRNPQCFSPIANRRFMYGHVLSRRDGQVVDEALAVFMRKPETYTREDVAEIHCHGSSIALRRTLLLVLSAGARPAEPGEFTQRAFLNGRLDLSQAESVMDLIQAKADRGYDVALGQLEGKLSAKVRELRQGLLELLALLTVSLDFPEEEAAELTPAQTEEAISRCLAGLDELLATADTGRILREGLRVAIAGKPNVGKSSLLNALLRESRAIVTEVPGTTRDTIEEFLNIEGVPVLLTDTAGIRETADKIEQLGIARSKDAFRKADLVVFVVDGSCPLTEEDLEIAGQIKGKPCVILANKRDLGEEVRREALAAQLPGAAFIEAVVTEGTGIKELEENILSLVYGGQAKPGESPLVSNVRQKDLLQKAREEAAEALALMRRGEPLEFTEAALHRSWELLGKITGETVDEDILNEVFSRFCLGK